MTKQMQAKIIQNYNAKPIFPICSNCKYFKSNFIENEYKFIDEKNIKCAIGEFAIKKQGTCEKHEFKN